MRRAIWILLVGILLSQLSGGIASAQCVSGTVCDDGDLCTENDFCIDEVCSGSPVLCPDDNNVCTGEVCDSALGCVTFPLLNGTVCDDGVDCTEPDTCSSGICLPGPATECPPVSTPCFVGMCDQIQGCLSVPAPTGTSCSDGNSCTLNDQCDSGTCEGTLIQGCVAVSATSNWSRGILVLAGLASLLIASQRKLLLVDE